MRIGTHLGVDIFQVAQIIGQCWMVRQSRYIFEPFLCHHLQSRVGPAIEPVGT